MNGGAFWELGDVTDRDLQAELTRLLASGSRTEAQIIAHLAAVEARRLHLAAGSRSLFDYCLRRLGLSESEAFHRITAARLARRFPAIFGLIERRAVPYCGVLAARLPDAGKPSRAARRSLGENQAPSSGAACPSVSAAKCRVDHQKATAAASVRTCSYSCSCSCSTALSPITRSRYDD